MPGKRRYRLLCPIARALDALGDRWALLILRDLHAGPARFGELESGLGIATNLLTTRLADLIESGLVTRASHEGRDHYELTDSGRATDRVLWELAGFGTRLPPDDDLREPGNLRTLVVPLRFMLRAVRNRPRSTALFVVDGEPVSIRTSRRSVTVDYGDTFAPGPPPDVEVHTDYDALVDVSEGRLEPDAFLARHVRVVAGADHAPAFLHMMAAGIEATS